MENKRGFLSSATVICPYCGEAAIYTDSAVVYGTSYGKIWLCKPCKAWVGSHPNGSPLGTLANQMLRHWRMRAHRAFDPLWKTGFMKRGEAYKVMQEVMGLSKDMAHIAMFDIDQCQTLIERLTRRYKDGSYHAAFGRPKLLGQDDNNDGTLVEVFQEVRPIEELHNAPTTTG